MENKLTEEDIAELAKLFDLLAKGDFEDKQKYHALNRGMPETDSGQQ